MSEENSKENAKEAAKTTTNQTPKPVKKVEEYGVFFYVQRVVALLLFCMLFVPSVNPAKVCGLISKNISLLTSAISYGSLTSDVGRAFRSGWVSPSVFYILMVGAIITLIGILALSVAACISLGNKKMKRLSVVTSLGGCIAALIGMVVIFVSYQGMLSANRVEKVEPSFPFGFFIFLVGIILVLAATLVAMFMVPKADLEEGYEMETKYKLFLMFLPFALLAFVFCYLPLWGWRYAFFDYRAGDTLGMHNFVGFKWFTYLFENEATKRDIVRVMQNTLAMSGLGILTSWLPMVFAIFLTELNSNVFKRFVQTFTTIPNFISWILIYTVALAIFSTDGFINTFAQSMGWVDSATNYLMGDSFTWIKMLAWGTWKGVGWGAIIYIAGISGIDKQLYEAATVDGAGRFQRIWHITVPGLMPTYMVMLLMSVAGMLSNGLDQYLVFSNASNMAHMEVLDLYVYHLGFEGGSIPLSTVIGMAKSIISVVLLFMANGISKLFRGESIV